MSIDDKCPINIMNVNMKSIILCRKFLLLAIFCLAFFGVSSRTWAEDAWVSTGALPVDRIDSLVVHRLYMLVFRGEESTKQKMVVLPGNWPAGV